MQPGMHLEMKNSNGAVRLYFVMLSASLAKRLSKNSHLKSKPTSISLYGPAVVCTRI
jgi:hypothetical protein